MMMLRTIATALILSAAAWLPVASFAQTPNVYQSFESGKAARPHADIRGRISSIDYASNTLTVNGATIAVTPSTSIVSGGNSYLAFSDLKKNLEVDVTTSVVDGRLVAQVIHVH